VRSFMSVGAQGRRCLGLSCRAAIDRQCSHTAHLHHPQPKPRRVERGWVLLHRQEEVAAPDEPVGLRAAPVLPKRKRVADRPPGEQHCGGLQQDLEGDLLRDVGADGPGLEEREAALRARALG